MRLLDSPLVLDERAVLVPNQISTNSVIVRMRLPTTYCTPLAVGSNSLLSITGEPGEFALLGLGVPSVSRSTPLGPTWLTPGTEVFFGPVVLDAQGAWSQSLPIPPIAALQYLTLAVQGVVSSTIRTMWTTPAVRVIR
jgi:hypothetical protein